MLYDASEDEYLICMYNVWCSFKKWIINCLLLACGVFKGHVAEC